MARDKLLTLAEAAAELRVDARHMQRYSALVLLTPCFQAIPIIGQLAYQVICRFAIFPSPRIAEPLKAGVLFLLPRTR